MAIRQEIWKVDQVDLHEIIGGIFMRPLWPPFYTTLSSETLRKVWRAYEDGGDIIGSPPKIHG